MDKTSLVANIQAARAWATEIIKYIQNLRGKWWYAAGAAALSYAIFPDVQSTTSARFANVSDLLIWLAHAPETFEGRSLLVAIAFVCLAAGVRANMSRSRSQQKIDQAEIAEILRVPRFILKQIARQQGLQFAEGSIRSSEMHVNNLKCMIDELKICSQKSSFEFESRYNVIMTLHNAVGSVNQAAHVLDIDANLNGIVAQEPKIPIADAGLGGIFRPDANEAFFEAHESNIVIIEGSITYVKEQIPRLREALTQEVENALRE